MEFPDSPKLELVETPARPARRPTSVLAVWVRDLLLALSIAAFIIIFLYQPVKVEGTSMMPSLEDQERIFVNKFVYRLGAIERGDIVVFRYPRDPSTSFIKRVIGVAGDRVRIEEGQLFLNDRPIEEDEDVRCRQDAVVGAGRGHAAARQAGQGADPAGGVVPGRGPPRARQR